jgi:hypothetical protein
LYSSGLPKQRKIGWENIGDLSGRDVRNGRIHQQTEKVSAKLTASSAVCKNSYEVLLKKSNAEARCR